MSQSSYIERHLRDQFYPKWWIPSLQQIWLSIWESEYCSFFFNDMIWIPFKPIFYIYHVFYTDIIKIYIQFLKSPRICLYYNFIVYFPDACEATPVTT